MGVISYVHGNTRLVDVVRIVKCWINVPHYSGASSYTPGWSLTKGTNYAIRRNISSFQEGNLISATSISGPIDEIMHAFTLKMWTVSMSTLQGTHALHVLNLVRIFILVQLWIDHGLCLCHFAL